MPVEFADTSAPSVPLYVVEADALPDWLDQQTEADQAWMTTLGFKASLGEVATIPNADGSLKAAVAGYGSVAARSRGRFWIAQIVEKLPAVDFHLEGVEDDDTAAEEALGWLLSAYRFKRYSGKNAPTARLKCPQQVDAERVKAIAEGEFLTRDLINTPANDMGPSDLADAALALAQEFNAECRVVDGKALEADFPLIHAVGRASSWKPRLVDLTWGSEGPALTLVGKGICFDTGGLNLKPGGAMSLMKKDMGGAATTLGLARMIMATGMPLRLRLLLPCAENAVSGDAFRPGDILKARNGKTIEINNTDAEGRLVLADALALASESEPDLIVSMATLTGAARVAVGPDIAPFYSTDHSMSDALRSASTKARDPVWELPFHAPYEPMIEPGIADLDNAPSGGFAGSITAALFLRRFAGGARYMHFDIYGWQPSPAPARPKGGVGQGARALLDALPEILDL